MKPLNISDVRNRLPVLVESVAQTREPVVVTRYGTPLAMIVPVTRSETQQTRYPLRGHPVTLADDFDEPLHEIWSALGVAETLGPYTATKRPRPKKGIKP